MTSSSTYSIIDLQSRTDMAISDPELVDVSHNGWVVVRKPDGDETSKVRTWASVAKETPI